MSSCSSSGSLLLACPSTRALTYVMLVPLTTKSGEVAYFAIAPATTSTSGTNHRHLTGCRGRSKRERTTAIVALDQARGMPESPSTPSWCKSRLPYGKVLQQHLNSHQGSVRIHYRRHHLLDFQKQKIRRWRCFDAIGGGQHCSTARWLSANTRAGFLP